MTAPVLDGLKIRKGPEQEPALGTRYDVHFDGVKIGWVYKSARDGEWSGHALLGEDAFRGVCVSRGEPTRAWTVREILFQVRRNGGLVHAWDVENFGHQVRVSVDRLEQELGCDE